MNRSRVLVAALLLAALNSGRLAAAEEPALIRVQHILVGFKGSVKGKDIARTKQQARALAESLVERARAGEEFGALVTEYTADSVPGIYVLTNAGAPRRAGAYTRKEMAPRFGNVAFGLEVGEVGLAEYHATLCPFGWHVILRLE